MTDHEEARMAALARKVKGQRGEIRRLMRFSQRVQAMWLTEFQRRTEPLRRAAAQAGPCRCGVQGGVSHYCAALDHAWVGAPLTFQQPPLTAASSGPMISPRTKRRRWWLFWAP